MYILANMWFQKLMLQFFFSIDKIVYNFISTMYNLLISISRTTIFSQADIAEFADRIYKLLAVFMIFKVTFSLIMYIVNPDDFSDKTKGISKLGTNIVITLCLLVLTPYIFSYAYELQVLVLEENTLAKIIMGDTAENDFLNTAGDEIAFMTISAFFNPNTALPELYDCSNLTIKGSDGNPIFNPECSGLNDDFTDAGDGESLMALTNDKYFNETLLKNYVTGVNNSNFGLTFREDLALATDSENDNFIMNYKYLFSTVVGVVVILLLLSFCMDIAVRSIKLAFLQLIAPIPIISYIDPKSGKDGLFKKWYEMCFKTYLSLFIRLLALYFAIYIISKVASLKMYDLVDGSYQTNTFVAIFIIIGALMFAKQLPKILEGLGIKLDGSGFNLNPLRKIEKEALGGGILKGANDKLAKGVAKGAKGLMKMPFSAASLGYRKFRAGMDSKKHGHGYLNGARSVKSKMAEAREKRLEKNAPYKYKALQEKREGKAAASLMHTQWKRGDQIREKIGGFDKLNGLSGNIEAYKKAGFRGSFLESKMKLDKESERQKILQRIHSARQMGTSLPDALAQEKDLGAYFTDKELVGIRSSDSGLYAALEKSNKTVEGAKTTHEIMRKKYGDQAALEDLIKFRKNNDTDPTRVSRVSDDDSSSESVQLATPEPVEADDSPDESAQLATAEPVEADDSPDESAQPAPPSQENQEFTPKYHSQESYDERIEYATEKLSELYASEASEDEIKAQEEVLRTLQKGKEMSAQKDKETDEAIFDMDDEFNDSWMSQGRANNFDDE